jgi:hypothetical protein
MDGTDPVRGEPIARLAGDEEERRATRTAEFAHGTLACPECDAPVHPGLDPIRPAAGLGCPVCGHAARVRDFLTLGPPLRPARVALRMVARPAVVRR